MTGNQQWAKDGLGKTGETYLVGPDFTMRSVSRFLIEDREGYFAALEKLDYPSKTISQLDEFDTSILLQRVQTKASFGALSGKSSTDIIEDYRGISVLSSYGPIQFGEHQWALISEIDEAEAFAPIDALARTLIISSILTGALMVGLAAYFSGQFTKPVISLANAARKIGEGASNISLEVGSNDEIGSLTKSFNEMVENLDSQRRIIELKNLENTRLLLNILPEPIAERLKSGEAQIADTFSSVSIIFTDLVGFTKWSKDRPPMEVLSMLDDLFGAFDATAARLGVEKIKTIGDAYMAVCGPASTQRKSRQRNGGAFLRNIGLFRRF
ncbi:HAMP domain-containing protein [Pseudomonadales bacterium]|nr:HAMP domain-containing protein [Pseudomonadales bacterium]